MPARCGGSLDRAVPGIDEMRGREDLFRRHHVVIAGREQKQRTSHAGEIDWAAQDLEAAASQPVFLEQLLDDLQVVGARQIDGPCVPLVKTGFQSPKGGRSDRVRGLQQVMDCLPVEQAQSPKLSDTVPQIRPPPRSTNSLKIAMGVSRAKSESFELPAAISIGAPARTSFRTLVGKRAA